MKLSMNIKEYIKLSNNYEFLTSYERNKLINYNKELLERYPWLTSGSDNCTYTLLDFIPQGWVIAFAEQMCEEIQAELSRCDCVEDFCITEIKEKYGTLRIYIGSLPVDCKVPEIIYKYEKLSEHHCIHCGAPLHDVRYIAKGWTSFYCYNCAAAKGFDNFHNGERGTPITE